MSIELANETDVEVDLTEIHDCARHAMDAMFVHPNAELSIRIVDEPTIERLHVDWMDLLGPTDVMSFPMDELTPGREGELSAEGMLGDIVLCPTIAAKQAEAAGHDPMEEMLLLTVHGVLHLLGYDHAEPDERLEMFELQRTILLTYLASRGRSVEAGTIRINPPSGKE